MICLLLFNLLVALWEDVPASAPQRRQRAGQARQLELRAQAGARQEINPVLCSGIHPGFPLAWSFKICSSNPAAVVLETIEIGSPTPCGVMLFCQQFVLERSSHPRCTRGMSFRFPFVVLSNLLYVKCSETEMEDGLVRQLAL